MKHFLYIPFTGLGLYGGFRGNRWLRNRIAVFKHFVVPSLQAQTNQNFHVWISWRREERSNEQVTQLKDYLESIFPSRVVFTYSGVCFWDDKYSDEEAQDRLATTLHNTMAELINHTGDADSILMTIQPSDDCFNIGMVDEVQTLFNNTNYQAIGYTKGYIMNYQTGEISEYNPKTNPPFFTIKFPKEVFIDVQKHMRYTGPYKSHEYIGEKLKYLQIPSRGFLVGTHGENISTHYKHPYAGDIVDKTTLEKFGILNIPPIKIPLSIRKLILRKLPHRVQRKLRYIFGEKFYAKLYSFIRS